jgi:hypothetical protein
VNVRLHARRQWPARDEPPADRPRSAKPPRGRMLLRAGESSLPRLACLDDGWSLGIFDNRYQNLGPLCLALLAVGQAPVLTSPWPVEIIRRPDGPLPGRLRAERRFLATNAAGLNPGADDRRDLTEYAVMRRHDRSTTIQCGAGAERLCAASAWLLFEWPKIREKTVSPVWCALGGLSNACAP